MYPQNNSQYSWRGAREQPINSPSEAELSEPEENSDQDVAISSDLEQTQDLDLAHQLAHTHLPRAPTPPSPTPIATNPVFPPLTPLPLSYAPTSSHPRPPSPMSSTKPTKLHIGAPEAFDRSYDKSTQWLNAVRFYLLVYDTDNKMIAFALSYMTKGSALTWATTFRQNTITGTTIAMGTFSEPPEPPSPGFPPNT